MQDKLKIINTLEPMDDVRINLDDKIFLIIRLR